MKTFQTYVFEKLKLNSQSKLKSYKYKPKTKEELKEYCIQIFKNTPEGQVCDLNVINTSKITNMQNLFKDISWELNDKKIEKIDISDWDVSNVETMENMFGWCHQLTDIGNLERWQTKKVVNMSYMFTQCESLKTIDGIDQWNMENITNLNAMFMGCKILTDVGNIGNWKFTSKLVSLSSIFKGCASLVKLDLSNWNVSSSINLSLMFENCYSLTDIGDLGKWIINAQKNYLTGMFFNCYNLEHIGDISNWDVQNLTSLSAMFRDCKKLTDVGDLTKWRFNNPLKNTNIFNGSRLPYKYWNKRIIIDKKK